MRIATGDRFKAARELAHDWAGEPGASPESVLALDAASRAVLDVLENQEPGRLSFKTEAGLTVPPGVDRDLADSARRFAETLLPEGNERGRQAAFDSAIGRHTRLRLALADRSSLGILADQDFLEAFDQTRDFQLLVRISAPEQPERETPEAVQLFLNDSAIMNGSGVLVGQRHVLTASHVIATKPRRIRVRQHFPEVRDFQWEDKKPVQRLPTSFCEFKVNGSTVRIRNAPDIALFELTEDHGFPAALPNEALTLQLPSKGAVAVGFGQQETGESPGQFGNTKPLAVLPLETCQTVDCSGTPPKWICRPEEEFVAGIGETEGGICQGDSGGPCYLWDPATDWSARRLIGINVRALKEGVCGNGGYFTRLDGRAGKWIRGILGR